MNLIPSLEGHDQKEDHDGQEKVTGCHSDGLNTAWVRIEYHELTNKIYWGESDHKKLKGDPNRH